MDRLKMHTADIADENIRKIGELFPGCLTERKGGDGRTEVAIDFDKLHQELSKVVVDGPQERYQFSWPGKREAIRLANTPSNLTLRPDRESSVDFDSTENLYIEGDNLEVLKLLREDYLGKVKMIYIDPPYNTGNDFVYEDDFRTENLEFRAESGNYDEEGNLLVNRMVLNTESNGRFHTDWLNMIYPRLKIARDLLTDDGVIFISIDDNEVDNLKKVCDEILGEGNFVATFPWRKRTAKSDVPFGVSQDYEWIVVYAKSAKFSASIDGKERQYYTTKDLPNRPWRVHDLTKQTTASERPNSFFTIVNPKNGTKYPANPNRTWCITEDTFNTYYKDNRIVFPGDYDFLNISRPVLRYWKEDDIKKTGDSFGRIAVSTKLDDNLGMSQDGTKEITTLFDGKVFSYPKPVKLIKFFANILHDENSIILDFFSGSATTAHAVMQLNAEEKQNLVVSIENLDKGDPEYDSKLSALNSQLSKIGNRKFIMVQLPELTDEKSEAFKAGYKNICEIGKERIRRAGNRILELSLENLEKEGVIERYARELSEVRSLEEVYGCSGISLLTGQEAAKGGDICADRPNEAGGGVDTIEHSGGTGPGEQGVRAVSEDSEGFASRTGDATVDLRTLELLNRRGYKVVLDPTRGNQQNDLFSDQTPANQILSSKLSALNSKLSVLSTDTGFRVLKLDSSNMEDVYYTPEEFSEAKLFEDNVKPGRSAEDLLFQVMLECNLPLSAKIERETIAGKEVFNVGDGRLIACFDTDINEEVITEVARRKPYCFIMRDSSLSSDNVADNFEQIFNAYSRDTIRKIL